MLNRLGWALSGALALLLVMVLGRALEAGPLDPPGAPGATMRTLDSLMPAWSLSLSANNTGDVCNSARFDCVLEFDNAVLDRETGLVWQRDPFVLGFDWFSGREYCRQGRHAAKGGWRLPTLQEIHSLHDQSSPLPAGHPFGVISTVEPYWTDTLFAATDPNNANKAYALLFNNSGGAAQATDRTATAVRTWCVRGGSDPTSD